MISFNYPASRVDVALSTPKRTVLIALSSSTAQISEVRKLEYSDKQVRSYLRRCVPLREFVKTVPSIVSVLIAMVLLSVTSRILFPLTLFPLVMTRLTILSVLVQILLLVRERVFGYRSRDQEISATIVRLKKAIQSIPLPRSVLGS